MEKSTNAASVAMYFIFEHAPGSRVQYTDRDGVRKPVHMGTYGFGIQRCMQTIVEQHRDRDGIAWPASVRPFDHAIIPLDPDDENQAVITTAIYDRLMRRGMKPLLDDRANKTLQERAAYADFIGVNTKLVLGQQELRNDQILVKRRGEKRGIPVALSGLERVLADMHQ